MRTPQSNIIMNARILWAITVKDFFASFKNKNIISLLITSVAIVFVYRALPMLEKQAYVRILVYDAGNSALVQTLEQSQAVRIYPYETEKQMKFLLADSEMSELGLVIPAGFDSSLQNSTPLPIQGYTQFWVKPEEAADMKATMESEFKRITGQDIAIELEGNLVYPTDAQDGLGTQASFSIVYLITFLGLILIPHLMLEEKQSRTLDALLVSPASPGMVVAAKALVGLAYCFLGTTVALIVNADVVLQWWPALLGILFGALFSVSLGLCLGSIINNRSQLSLWAWVFIIPLLIPMIITLLGDLVPETLLQAMHVVPTTALFYVSRASFSTPVNVNALVIRLVWMAVCAMIGFWAASKVLDWQTQAAAGEIHPVQRWLQRFTRRTPTSARPVAAAEIKIVPEARRRPAGSPQPQPANGPLHKIWAIAVKDLREAVHNKLIISILVGTGMLLVTNALFPILLRVQSKPMVVVNIDGSSEIIRQLAEDPDSRLVAVRSQAEMEALLTQAPEPRLGLVIPEGFDALISQGADLNLMGYTAHWASEKQVTDLTAFFSEKLAQLAGRPVKIETIGHAVYPTLAEGGGMNLSLVNLVLIVTVLGVALMPLMIVEEKLSHTMDALIVSPASKVQIFLGKSLAGILLCLVALSVSVLVYQHLVVHWAILILAVLLSTIFLVITGLLLGMLSDNPATISLWGSMILLLMLGLTMAKAFLSINLPPFLADIVPWTPGSLMVELFGLSMVGLLPLDRVLFNAAGLIAFSLVMAGLVLWRLRQMDR